MSEEETACPECHYSTYKYYMRTVPPGTYVDPETKEELPTYYSEEVPVVVKSVFGWLCRLCLYEWEIDGTPIDPEKTREHGLKIRQWGKESHAEIQSLQGSAK